MTQIIEVPDKRCPRCAGVVAAERFVATEGVAWLWRCACGWSSAMAESGVMSRRDARRAVDEALEKG
jgi:hypothetical protein